MKRQEGVGRVVVGGLKAGGWRQDLLMRRQGCRRRRVAEWAARCAPRRATDGLRRVRNDRGMEVTPLETCAVAIRQPSTARTFNGMVPHGRSDRDVDKVLLGYNNKGWGTSPTASLCRRLAAGG